MSAGEGEGEGEASRLRRSFRSRGENYTWVQRMKYDGIVFSMSSSIFGFSSGLN